MNKTQGIPDKNPSRPTTRAMNQVTASSFGEYTKLVYFFEGTQLYHFKQNLPRPTALKSDRDFLFESNTFAF
jgi:hypothetical protein